MLHSFGEKTRKKYSLINYDILFRKETKMAYVESDNKDMRGIL